MAETPNIDDIAKAAPPNEAKEKEQPKQVGTLESVVDETLNAAKHAGAFAAGISFPFMFSGENRTNAMINAYPLAAGSTVEDLMLKKPINPVKSMKESFVGTIMAPPLAGLFKYINVARDYTTASLGYLPGAATAVGALALAQAVFIGVYTGLNHIVQNFSFKGLYDKFKSAYWKTVKNTWKYVLPLSMWNVLWFYKFGIAAQMVYSSAMSFLFRLVGPKQEGASLSNLYSELKGYAKGALTATGNLARNVFYAPLNAAYALGSSIRDLYKKAPKAPPTQPATAPAGAR